MGLPHHFSRGGSGPGHGPFGEKAFKGALLACAVLIGAGIVMIAAGGDDVRGAGIALIVVCGVGLLTAGAGLLAERLMRRTPPPPPDVRGSNGHGRYSHDRRRRPPPR
jgi:hypothetical protein